MIIDARTYDTMGDSNPRLLSDIRRWDVDVKPVLQLKKNGMQWGYNKFNRATEVDINGEKNSGANHCYGHSDEFDHDLTLRNDGQDGVRSGRFIAVWYFSYDQVSE